MTRLLIGVLAGAVFLPAVAAAAACEDWVATVVSVQGTIQGHAAGEAQWRAITAGSRHCFGDTIRVLERSRAAIRLRNDALLRLDQNTTITFAGPRDQPAASWIDLLRGALHFTSRVPRGLKVLTPFVNGTVEGTEFWIEVAAERTMVTVFEGRLAAENAAGRLLLETGQSAIARAGQPPVAFTVVRPRDTVQWALYYPAVADFRVADFPDIAGEDWPAKVRQSIDFYRKSDLPSAFASLDQGPPPRDPRFFTYRAVLLLSVGRVDEARADIEHALRLDRDHPIALALLSIIAVVRNDKAEALSLGRRAAAAIPPSAAARVALAYAQQANVDLPGALESLQEAVTLEPDASLAWARLAEVWLSFGRVREALEAADRAARLNPDLARTQTVLGYAYLALLRTRDARQAFERAIGLDQADPLARLGLGLARIQQGELEAGRRELEIAVSLDPDNALVRSYLGKAYFEERRAEPASEQFGLAKGLDANDPTPWFYDAIHKQSLNRPVQALHDLQRAIELNDHRAIYRSRLLLDEDLAARSASLARIYDDLGFQQLALVEGWKSVNADPGNHSAHRFLADAYAGLPRHEFARVSELLQSQLLQPLNVTPLQPRLGARNLSILSGVGPADPSFNEFNPLFNRNRVAFQLSGLYGGNRTFGDEATHSAVWNSISYSLGQFHYETQGFRPNNDVRDDVYNAFVQARLSHATSVQAELRSQKTETGDLLLRFDPKNFSDELRQTADLKSIRVGGRHAFTPSSVLIASFIYQRQEFGTDLGEFFTFDTDLDSGTAEVQHLLRSGWFSLVAGAGYFKARRFDRLGLPFLEVVERTRATIQHTNMYAYTVLSPIKALALSLGVSADFFEGGERDRNQINPKVGVTWTPLPATTVRAAFFRTFSRGVALANPTLEPTQVAGFNQFYDGGEAMDAWRVGVGLDQKVSADVHAGGEVTRRWQDIPLGEVIDGVTRIRSIEWREDVGRAYLYWTPAFWLALSAEYVYERLRREDGLDEGLTRARTHQLPLMVSVSDPSGFQGRLRTTFVDQRVRFTDGAGESRRDHDRFVVVDASIGYRLPRRWGLLTLEAKNLLDQRFRFQDSDPTNRQLAPERLILGRFTLAY